MIHPGTVYLVGAGPGDPGLITLRGAELLNQADVVLYDRLVDDRLLRGVRPDSDVTYVGKLPGTESTQQDQIIARMIDRAQAGKSVVRLKGGDPFVFGRGGEEALALAEANVPFEVVPGITSAIAAPAYAGIPLTHRQMASSFTVVSGSEDPSKEDSLIDWRTIASGSGTLVVLMGWDSLGRTIQQLTTHGLPLQTPAALVQWGTETYQRTVEGTLENVLERGREEGLQPPVVAIFGPVVELRQKIQWFDNRPLHGKRILVTRAREQAGSLSDLIAAAGGEPVELPTIQIAPPSDGSPLQQAARSLSSYQWLVLTSANAVDALFHAMNNEGLDTRALAEVRVAAIGPATADALTRYGVRADCVPARYVSEALVDELKGRVQPGDSVLHPRAESGREVVVDGLSALGATVHQVAAYRTAMPEGAGERARELLISGQIDVVTFASSSSVRNLVELLGGDVNPLKETAIACIGPITETTARELGLQVQVQTKEHTIQGLVQAMIDHFSAR